MFIAGIIIYIILAILLGPLWPLQMFGRGGLTLFTQNVSIGSEPIDLNYIKNTKKVT